MNDIEEKLWDYIDGSCTEREAQEMHLLIGTNEQYRLKYNELLQLNATLANIELDGPPMAFTYNVMEAIRTETKLKPLNAAIDKRIIRGIAAFFVLAIAALLIFMLANINWSAGMEYSLDVQVSPPNLSGYFKGPVLQVFVLFDVVLSLFLLDTYLRKKLAGKDAD